MSKPRTSRPLVDLAHQTKPQYIFLIQTMVHWDRLERVRQHLRFHGLFVVNSAHLMSFSSHHIDIIVNLPNFLKWRLTGFYGYACRSHKREMWHLLRKLSTQSQLPWSCIGDYNDFLLSSRETRLTPHPPGFYKDSDRPFKIMV